MTDHTAQPLGDRMKAYEAVTRQTLPRRTHTIIRVDGRAFHSYLRGADKPFDAGFAETMDATAEALCAEITGAQFAYVQSDEISVLVTDFAAPGTQPWFGGVVAKQVSIAASVATATLNQLRPGRRALFDARVFTIPDRAEVAAYFCWRQHDAIRNSVSMAAQSVFSSRRLLGVKVDGMRDMLLAEHGIDWHAYPAGFKYGRVTLRRTGERDTTWTDKRTGETHTTQAVRTWWETLPAPVFTTVPDEWLMNSIPIPRTARSD